MSGRTSWWPKDAAWHRRERIVELGHQFGAPGLTVMDVLSSWAQEQKSTEGRVRGGYRTLAREAFCDIDEARAIVAGAAEIGALHDLEPSKDGRLFECRVSGWAADQTRGRAAWRQQEKRDRDRDVGDTETGEEVTPRHASSRDVTGSPPPDQTRHKKKNDNGEAESPDGETKLIFSAWVEATGRDPGKTKLTADRRRRIELAIRSHGSEDCLAAVRNIGKDGWARGDNDRGRRFDDIEHALGKAERIERWRDWTPSVPGRPVSDVVARGDALIRQAVRGAG